MFCSLFLCDIDECLLQSFVYIQYYVVSQFVIIKYALKRQGSPILLKLRIKFPISQAKNIICAIAIAFPISMENVHSKIVW